MANTLNRAYRYPGQGDEPDVPLRIQQLAEDIDADMQARVDKDTALDTQLARLPYKIAAGQGSMSIASGAATATEVITLSGFTGVPSVTANITTSTTGRASLLNLQVIARSATSITFRLTTSDNAALGTTSTIGYTWIAVQ